MSSEIDEAPVDSLDSLALLSHTPERGPRAGRRPSTSAVGRSFLRRRAPHGSLHRGGQPGILPQDVRLRRSAIGQNINTNRKRANSGAGRGGACANSHTIMVNKSFLFGFEHQTKRIHKIWFLRMGREEPNQEDVSTACILVFNTS